MYWLIPFSSTISFSFWKHVRNCKTKSSLYTKSSKACSVDGLSVEHFIFARDYTYTVLSIVFNAFLTHVFVPDTFMKYSIVPLIKNKTGDTNDKHKVEFLTCNSLLCTSMIYPICESHLLKDRLPYWKYSHYLCICICLFTLTTKVTYYMWTIGII